MSQQTIVLDPVSRVEGHLRIELDIEGNVVKSAKSTGTSFRGFESVLAGRDPRDAPLLTQRICGVCPVPQARASVAAFEAAAGLSVNTQARLLRNIVEAANFIESHILHFYLMALPDYVAGLPTAASGTSTPKVWEARAGLDATKLAEHVVLSLQARRNCTSIIGLLGGKMPHPVGIVPGGATASVSSDTKSTLADLASRIYDFVAETYRADVASLANAFPEYLDIGASGAAYLSFGGYPEANGTLALSGGVVWEGTKTVSPLDVSQVTESVARSYYEADTARNPRDGVTKPDLGRDGAYTWIKAPRLYGHVCEVGPLARAIVAGMSPAGRGVHGRHMTRVGEALFLAERCKAWITELTPGVSGCPSLPRPPLSAEGVGLVEAPRGSLGHWLTIEDGVIRTYQVISPTTWNGSPRSEDGAAGPMEKALENVEVADPSDPIEALRVVHSFDPCLQCSVH